MSFITKKRRLSLIFYKNVINPQLRTSQLKFSLTHKINNNCNFSVEFFIHSSQFCKYFRLSTGDSFWFCPF